MKKILPASFFDRPTLMVARELLGKYIVRKWRGKNIALMITEVEAYDGLFDLASHASHGRTPRTSIMFGEAGRFYIFFTYGIHWMANIVTGPKDYPAAILLRAGLSENGEIAKGPARLTKFLHIDGTFNGIPASKKSGLWLEDRRVKIKKSNILAVKRIGVDYAGPIWSEKEYNFRIKNTLKTE